MNYKSIGQSVLNFSQLGSTNDYASFLLSVGEASDGMVIMAGSQFAGKGQRGRVWYSVPGESLTFSIILKDCGFAPEKTFVIQIIVALAIRRWAAGYISDTEVMLKWPNDVMVNGKKLAGVLTETQIQGGEVSALVIGIGINLNQSEFPAGMGNPVSLYMISGSFTGPEVELQSLCASVREVFAEWISGQEQPLFEEYSRYFYGKGQWRTFSIQGTMIEAMPEGINDQGSLVLRNRDGSLRVLDSANVEWL